MYFVIACLICVRIAQVSAAASAIDENRLFAGSECKVDNDCAIKLDKDPFLSLQCNVTAKQCKCSLSSDYAAGFWYLGINYKDAECFMSKYGPCGKALKSSNSAVEVGCAPGFSCTAGRCLDPKHPGVIMDHAVRFPTADGDCVFSYSPMLELELEEVSGKKYCVCKIKSSNPGTTTELAWSIRNYDKGKNCTVGKSGPCGLNAKLGIEIGCHGPRVGCDGENCQEDESLVPNEPGTCSEGNKKCNEKGLICNHDAKKCIRPHSVPDGEICSTAAGPNMNIECLKDHECWVFSGEYIGGVKKCRPLEKFDRTRNRNSATNLSLPPAGIFKLKMLIPIILSVVIPNITNS